MGSPLHQRLLGLAAGALALCTVATAAPLRIASINIELGLEARGTVGHDALADVLRRVNADLVALQEVRSQDLGTNLDNLATTLGLGHQYVSDAGPLDTNNRNAFLSRYPISSSTSITSPPGAVDMTRTAPAVVIDVPGITDDPTIITVHLKCCFEIDDPFRRAVEIDRVVDHLTASALDGTDNVIILGDFNLLGTTNITFTTLPPGLPLSYGLGSDITYPVEYSPDPSAYFTSFPFATVPIFQADGSTDTAQGSSSILDHILVSPAISNRPFATEIYNSAHDATIPGLPKAGLPLPSNTSNNASDHYVLFGDFELVDSVPLGMTISNPSSAETDSSGAIVLTITLPAAPGPGESVEVTLSSSDPTEAIPLQASLTFTTGVSTIQVDVAPQRDNLLDGPQIVTFNADASGFAPAKVDLTVTDSNTPDYTFTTPGETITESFEFFDGSADPARWPVSSGPWQGIDDGNSTSAGNFSYGSAADPSLGILLGSGAVTTTAGFVNNTGTALTALQIDFDAEQWRSSQNGAPDTWTAEFLINNTPFPIPGLSFTANTTLPTGAIPGGATITVSTILPNLDIPDGNRIELRLTATPGADGGAARPNDVFVNEIHYDNANADVGEFIEVVVGPGNSSDLADLSVVLYNGNGGGTYGTHNLDSFTLDATLPSGHAIYSKLIPNIQNGSPDGFAVVDNGRVLHFLSYEGVMVATNGPATGLTSTDLGVSQPNSAPPIGEQSIGLQGSGGEASEFTWVSFAGSYTQGSSNEGQSFTNPGGSQGVSIDNFAVTFLIDTDGDGDPDLTDPDDDNDTLPDSAETLLGTDPLLADTNRDGTTDDNEDADGDHQSNASEILVSLTDPLDHRSLFEIAATPNPGFPDSVLLTFPSLPGRTYHVERSHNLQDWNPLNSLPGTGSLLMIPAAGLPTETRNFFRVGIGLP